MQESPCPLLLHRTRREHVLRVPAGVPPLPHRNQPGESLLEWFLRHHAPDASPDQSRLLERGGERLLRVPRPGCRLPPHPEGIDPVEAIPAASRPGAPAWLDPGTTSLYRCVGLRRGKSGLPLVDRIGDHYLGTYEDAPRPRDLGTLAAFCRRAGGRGCYSKVARPGHEAEPVLIWGESLPPDSLAREWGVSYRVDLVRGQPSGIFPDQRENRHRILTDRIAPGLPAFPKGDARVLNAFAHSCGFSLCAALAGARTTSVDLSSRFLELGRWNFRNNGLDPVEHEFLRGDVFGWFRRLARRGRRFDMLVLDPPTFSRSRESGAFRVERDLPPLVRDSLPLLSPGGWILVSTNKASWAPSRFRKAMREAVADRGLEYFHQDCEPWDYRHGASYLKTIWMKLG